MAIKNTSELRQMLLKTIEEVRSGKVEPRQAGAVASLAAKVLQSAKLDLEVLKYNGSDASSPRAGSSVLQLVN